MILDALRGVLAFKNSIRASVLQSIVCLFINNNGIIRTSDIDNENLIALNRLYDDELVQYSDDGVFFIECMVDIPETIQESMFQEFWKEYPLEGKVGKQKSLDIVKRKFKTKAMYRDLMLSLKTYKEFLEKKQATFGKMPYIKHAPTFLNNYKDFLPESGIDEVIDNIKSDSSKKLDNIDEMWGRLSKL